MVPVTVAATIGSRMPNPPEVSSSISARPVSGACIAAAPTTAYAPADDPGQARLHAMRPGGFPGLKAEAKAGGVVLADLGGGTVTVCSVPAPAFRSARAASVRAAWPRLRRSRSAHAGSGGLCGPRRRARQAAGVGSGTVMVALAGRLVPGR